MSGRDQAGEAELAKAYGLLKQRRFEEVIRVCEAVLQAAGPPPQEREDDSTGYRFFRSTEDFAAAAAVYSACCRAAGGREGKDLVWAANTPAEALFLQGFAYIELHRYAEAARRLERAISYWPTNPRYLNELGHCHQAMREGERAIASFERALAACREFPFPWLLAQIERGPSPGETVGLRQMARARHRVDEARALRGIGFQFIEMGKLEEAEAKFRESLEIEPGNVIAHNELGVIQQLREKGGTARRIGC